MKIYTRIYSTTVKFIIPLAYHAREVVETPSSELLRLMNKIRCTLETHLLWIRWCVGHGFDDIIGHLSPHFAGGHKEKVWPVERL